MSKKLPIISCNDKNFGKRFVRSLHQTGFAVITDTGVNLDLLKSVPLSWLYGFFLQSEGFKKGWKADPSSEIGFVEQANSSSSKIADLKQFAMVKPDHQNHSLPGAQFASTVELYQQLTALGTKLLGTVEQNLPESVLKQYPLLKGLCDKSVGSDANVMRINYYPAPSANDDPNAVPARKHTDISVLTLLAPSEQAGLYVWDRDGNELEVPYAPGCLVINIGEQLNIMTGGSYDPVSGYCVSPGWLPATFHEVRNAPRDYGTFAGARMSIPVFMHLRRDETVKTFSREEMEFYAGGAFQRHLNDAARDQLGALLEKVRANSNQLSVGDARDVRLSRHGFGKTFESDKK